MYYFDAYTNRDNRVFLAPCYYICLRTCKCDDRGMYTSISWENFMWIITQTNIHHLKKWNNLVIPCDFIARLDDEEFIPLDFEESWIEDYILNKNGTIKRKNGKPITREIHYEYTWEDYISEAAFESLNRAILKWKIYGKFYVAIRLFIYSIKTKIDVKFNELIDAYIKKN